MVKRNKESVKYMSLIVNVFEKCFTVKSEQGKEDRMRKGDSLIYDYYFFNTPLTTGEGERR